MLYPIFDQVTKRRGIWEALVTDLGAREMESGLVRLVVELLVRLHRTLGGDLDQLVAYVVNNASAWAFPEVVNEKPADRERARAAWNQHVAMLDTAILSLMGEQDVPDTEIAATLDAVLQSSLWDRRLRRLSENDQKMLRTTLLTRARVIWSKSTAVQRRGYFLAGLGLEAGHALDAIAAEANELLVQANGAVLTGDQDAAIAAITSLAELVFVFAPFSPDPLPAAWKQILKAWLLGLPLHGVAQEQASEALRFIENGLVYKLPWAMESIRVRAIANCDTLGDFLIDDFELGVAVPAVETGTLNRSATYLIQAGFNSRLAAIKVVQDTGASFTSGAELRAWLKTDDVRSWTATQDWPTAATKPIWLEWVFGFVPPDSRTWSDRRFHAPVKWEILPPPPPGTPVRVHHLGGHPLILSASGERLGRLVAPLNPSRSGLARITVATEPMRLDLSYLGPDDLWVT